MQPISSDSSSGSTSKKVSVQRTTLENRPAINDTVTIIKNAFLVMVMVYSDWWDKTQIGIGFVTPEAPSTTFPVGSNNFGFTYNSSTGVLTFTAVTGSSTVNTAYAFY